MIDEIFTGEYEEKTGDGWIMGSYVGGKKNGKTKVMSSDRKIICELFFKDDIIDGELIQYYESGRILAKICYKNGVQHGNFVSFFENGMKQMEMQCVNGKIDGIQICYDEFGDESVKSEYKNGTLHGKFITYYPKQHGGGILEYSTYKDGLLNGNKTCFYDTGEVLSITPYIDGKAQEYTKTFTKTGKVV